MTKMQLAMVILLSAPSDTAVAPGRYRVWHLVTRLNERHPVYAWLSLGSVGLTDLYIRLVSMGIIRDLRII